MLITVTKRAAAKLNEIIAAKGDAVALRIIARPGCCSGFEYSMALERNPRPDDRVLQKSGLKIIVDPGSAEFLEGVSIDYVDNVAGGGFAIHNPRVYQSCDCDANAQVAAK